MLEVGQITIRPPAGEVDHYKRFTELLLFLVDPPKLVTYLSIYRPWRRIYQFCLASRTFEIGKCRQLNALECMILHVSLSQKVAHCFSVFILHLTVSNI